MKILRPAISLFILLSIITGVIYPLLVTGIGRLAFSRQVDGSLMVQNGVTIGSTLIGQNFTAVNYFWGRPSATSTYPYNATASGGSNLGPLNPALIEQVTQRIQILHEYPHPSGAIPVDLLTTSASGLDPQISPAAALYQVPRVAAARGITEDKLRDLVKAQIQPRQWGVFGEPTVNVLLLNLAVEQLQKGG